MKPCKAWCGIRQPDYGDGHWRDWSDTSKGSHVKAYCTPECRDAHRALAPEPCKAYCGSRWDTHSHDNDTGEIFQDMPERVRMTRCFCTAECLKAGKALNPRLN